MKKILSLMLSLALIISTLALPLSAFADGDEAAKIKISFSYGDVTEVKPGDELSVDVTAYALDSSDQAIEYAVTAYSVFVSYDKDKLTYKSATFSEGQTAAEHQKTKARVLFLYEKGESDVTIPASGLKLGTMKFTVEKGAAAANTYSFGLAENQTEFSKGTVDTTKFTYTSDENSKIINGAEGISIADNTYSVKYQDGETQTDVVKDKVYYGVKDSRAFTIAADRNFAEEGAVSVTKNGTALTDTELIKNQDGTYTFTASAPAEGTDDKYVVSVKLYGETEAKTTAFTLSASEVKVGLELDGSAIDSNKAGIFPGEDGKEIEVPVKITGVSENLAVSMVTFSVDTLPTGITFEGVKETDDDIKRDDNKIIVGDNTTESERNIAAEGKLVTLKFKVGNTAGVGVNEIKLADDAQVALKKDVIDTERHNATIGTSAYIVVVPEKFASAANDSSTTSWTNQAYNINISNAASGASIKYVKYDYQNGSAPESAKAAYNASQNEINDNKVNVSETKNYYIVARIGSDGHFAYQTIGDFKVIGADENKSNQIWYDDKKPELNADEVKPGVLDAKSEMSVDISKLTITKTANLSGLSKFSYALGTDDTTEKTWNEVSNFVFTGDNKTAAITISARDSFKGKIYFKAADEAGNEGEASADITMDADDPKFENVNVGELTADNKMPITGTVTDFTDVTLKVYIGGADTDYTDASAVESGITGENNIKTVTVDESGSFTYNAEATGKYYFIAEDKAGHKSLETKTVTFTSAAAAGIEVKTNSNDTQFRSGFMPSDDTRLNKYEGSNGIFGYVNVKVKTPAEGYTDVVTVKKDDENLEASEGTTWNWGEGVVFDTAGAYEITVTTQNSTTGEKDKIEKSYKFTIADGQSGMKSPNGDAYYTIDDYLKIRNVLLQESETEEKLFPTEAYNFSGYFAGDLNGDLEYGADDYNAIISALKAFQEPGEYNFGIMCGAAAPTASQGN